MHGGILGILINCHSICTAMDREYYAEGRAIGDGEQIWCVTGTMRIKNLKPTPMNQAIELTARVADITRRRTTIECAVTSGGVTTVKANVIAFRMEPGWSSG